jgi:hypothetical protein
MRRQLDRGARQGPPKPEDSLSAKLSARLHAYDFSSGRTREFVLEVSSDQSMPFMISRSLAEPPRTLLRQGNESGVKRAYSRAQEVSRAI